MNLLFPLFRFGLKIFLFKTILILLSYPIIITGIVDKEIDH
jgi:hypothetical protein